MKEKFSNILCFRFKSTYSFRVNLFVWCLEERRNGSFFFCIWSVLGCWLFFDSFLFAVDRWSGRIAATSPLFVSSPVLCCGNDDDGR